ncbi:Vmc-like lipoprotein signal peptide domain-containing protein [Mycoplasma todarodis]|uniref:Lipoprotein n=1 Tax=Mycoplasma todarodis TaxID=1937191 RepID=A0A4R0XRR7_9MOLU|nr:hypothetical protein [Mycoplasma todarodis]TCG11575.1 hypothetical protein C4B25_01175 [Mycoplasma todarodis]
MKIKKAFLGTSLIALTTAPIAVAVSCGDENIPNWKGKSNFELKVGQELAMEQQDAHEDTFGFSLTQQLAEETMKLQIWLSRRGFTLFSNATSMFENLTTDIPDVRYYDYLLTEKEKRKLTTKECYAFGQMEIAIQKWIQTKVNGLISKTRNFIQNITWTNGGKDILEGLPRSYKVEEIKNTLKGIAIKTTLSTQPPKGRVTGYFVRDPFSGKIMGSSEDKEITIKDAHGDLDKIIDQINSNKAKGDEATTKDETLLTKYVISKRFLGIRFSKNILTRKTLSKSLSMPEALLEIKKENEYNFKQNVNRFRKIEEYINNLVMEHINKNNGDITKIFGKEMYTYKPAEIIKDLQRKVKKNPKFKGLIGDVKPENISWIK